MTIGLGQTLANEKAGYQSAQLSVSVTVVRGNNTASPEATVQSLQCLTNEVGETICTPIEESEKSKSETTSPCSPTLENEVCWY